MPRPYVPPSLMSPPRVSAVNCGGPAGASSTVWVVCGVKPSVCTKRSWHRVNRGASCSTHLE